MKARQLEAEQVSRVIVVGIVVSTLLVIPIALVAREAQAQFVTKLVASNGQPGDEFGRGDHVRQAGLVVLHARWRRRNRFRGVAASGE